ncbi:MAG: hypothetical protein MJZ45_03220 [Bacteroidales bacterium]|nr:hypothetical protein [Bacteroidales bacterium]
MQIEDIRNAKMTSRILVCAEEFLLGGVHPYNNSLFFAQQQLKNVHDYWV